MRGRHFPRLCRSCDAPMAGQEDSCWRCGAAWDYRSARPGARVDVRGGQSAGPGGGRPSSAPAAIGEPRAVAQARLARHRFAEQAGSQPAQGPRRSGAQVAARR
jgi:hypothetical protein